LLDKAFMINCDIQIECLSVRLQHEIGSCDPYSYLHAKRKSQSLQTRLEAKYGVAEDDEPEHKPKFKI